MKFGGSSVANAERMWEVALIVCSFPELYPCIVLSAMGKVCLQVLQMPMLYASLCQSVYLLVGTSAASELTEVCLQTTNLLLQAGEEALTAHPGSVATLSPLRSVHSST